MPVSANLKSTNLSKFWTKNAENSLFAEQSSGLKIICVNTPFILQYHYFLAMDKNMFNANYLPSYDLKNNLHLFGIMLRKMGYRPRKCKVDLKDAQKA